MADTKGFFEQYLPNKLKKNPDLAKTVNAVFQFDIKDAGVWTLDLTGEGVITEGPSTNAGCVITCDKATWEGILDNPASAFQKVMTGKLKVSNTMLATKLQKILG
jgi:putative sterol carrier protein